VCATCEKTDKNCLTCSDENRDVGKGCACKDTFYNSGTNPKCLKCEYPCVNCTDPKTCITCVSEASRIAAPTCACNNGWFTE
jgi:hypothetical protein